MSARSWDSYKETLYEVLELLKPETVLEFGSGFSTQIMGMYPSVVSLLSVEHDKEYYEKNKGNCSDNTKLVYEPNLDTYAKTKLEKKTDFVFVDGRNRSACLREVRCLGCPVMLHDADREQYREAVLEYKFQIWTDEMSTVTLTDDEGMFKRLSEVLRGR